MLTPPRTRSRDAPEEEAGPATLPLARVKRIIRLDPDVKQTQLDAVRLISRATVRARTAAAGRSAPRASQRGGVPLALFAATGRGADVEHARRAQELFVEALAAGAYGVMKGTKRKTIKFSDIGARHTRPRGFRARWRSAA